MKNTLVEHGRKTMKIKDIEKEIDCFINDPVEYDEKSIKSIKKVDVNKVGLVLKKGIETIRLAELKAYMQKESEEKNISLGAFMQVLRVAVVGSLSGPDLIPLITVIGKNVTLRSLNRLINMQL